MSSLCRRCDEILCDQYGRRKVPEGDPFCSTRCRDLDEVDGYLETALAGLEHAMAAVGCGCCGDSKAVKAWWEWVDDNRALMELKGRDRRHA